MCNTNKVILAIAFLIVLTVTMVSANTSEINPLLSLPIPVI